MSDNENTTQNQEEPNIPRFCYSLVLAEVIFQTDKGVGTHRVQLFSKADVETFPANRLAQIQNSAAHQVQGELPDQDKNFKTLEVIILNIQNLGWMSDEEFWGSKEAIPTVSSNTETAPETTKVNDGNNVIPIQRP